MKEAAKFLKAKGSEIMKVWEEAATKQVLASEISNPIALYNHLPQIIDNIAEIMIRYDSKDELNISDEPKFREIVENSEYHGRHRATSVLYTSGQIIHEYILFHRTISDMLIANGALDLRVSNLLKYVIETCILKSVKSFDEALRDMQDKLVGTLAHDIRNPLTVALLASEMMEHEQDELLFKKFQKSAIRSIKKSILLCEGLLDSVSVRAGEGIMLNFEEHDMKQDIIWIYDEAVDIYSHEIILNCSHDEIIAVCDGVAIRRLMENLITNAIKYGTNKKPVTISVDDEGDSVRLSVHNHGEPITASRQKEIFKFLDSTSHQQPTSSGWGMGLTLVQMVAEAHGGTVELISNREHGTTFAVVIHKFYNQNGKKRSTLKMFDTK